MTAFDAAAESPTDLTDRPALWDFVRRFAAAWTTPLTEDDGCTDAELDEAERRLGSPLPAALREAYGLFGRRPDLTSNQDRLLAPHQWEVFEGALVYRTENQSVVDWGFPLASAAEPDPPTAMWTDLLDKTQERWEPWLDRLSLALVEVVLSESLFGDEDLAGDAEPVDGLDACLDTAYQRLPFPAYPDPDGIRWYAGPDVLLRHDGDWLWLRARTPEALDAVPDALPATWTLADSYRSTSSDLRTRRLGWVLGRTTPSNATTVGAVAESEQNGPTRRRALLLLGGAAGVAAFGGADAAHVNTSRVAAARPPVPEPRPRAVLHPSPTPTPKPTPTPRPASWTPAKLTTAKHPVRYLDELSPAPPPNTIALSIDDGPHPTWTPRVLDLLEEHQIHATFFMIGEQVAEWPKLVQRVAAAGHQICNHTWTHPMLSGLPEKRLRREIVHAHDKIAQTAGIVPQFFRAPGGDWSKRVYDMIAEYDMIPIDWSVDPRDWSRPGVGHIRRTLLTAKAGNILLCHDGGGDRSQTLSALKKVIPKLKKRGLVFTSL
ncbi:polysaccharide deacetylase family protein [Actinomadura atramentaria]|uniref:polysaccharide deacetylase family protein n=1 Tax=Actinomadura atramentaria TaxID=1990 RepID=UPI0003652122|nr:polysaccharide deacetylase family protein [Actinomadura atramentaria]